jgi:hypothetical protein
MIIRQVSKSPRIKHFRTNRDILGETDARHCQPPGAWRIGVHHDLSPVGRNASLKSAAIVPRKCSLCWGRADSF